MKELAGRKKIRDCVASLAGRPGFPAFSAHVQAILAAVDEDEISVRELTRLIMRDYSLSLSLLRRANAHNLSGKPILSIAHAVVMLGTEAVRHLAAGLLIFEQFHNKPAGVRELMTLSMLTANHVRDVAARLPEVQPEEAYLCGMVRNLGEVLAAYYLPAEYARILKLVEERKRPLSVASLQVLQFTLEDLGEAVVRHWGMPERVAECQHASVSRPATGKPPDSLMAAVSLGHLMTTAAYRMEPDAGAAHLKTGLADHYPWLRLNKNELDEILAEGIRGVQQSFAAMGVNIDDLRLKAQTRRVLDALAEADGAPIPNSAEGGDTLAQLTEEIVTALDADPDLDLNTVIQLVLEALHRGAGFERVVFALLNQDRTQMEGRIGVGEGVDRLIERFQFPMLAGAGPVSAALVHKRRVIVDPCDGENSYIGRVLGVNCLCLYPIVVAGQAVACLYMESDDAAPQLGERRQRLFEKLRGCLVTAIEHSRQGVAGS